MPLLTDNSIHLLWANLDDYPHLPEQYETVLSKDERSRAKKFRFGHLTRRFVMRRALLRYLLSAYGQGAASGLAYRQNAHGKPELETTAAGERLYFNVSHSGAIALYGFTFVGEIGVDIERLTPLDDMPLVAQHYFSSDEQKALWSLPPDQQLMGFYNCWTRKEAIIKAVGTGLALPLDSFSVSLAPDEPVRIKWTEDTRLHHVKLCDVSVHKPYVAAVALYTPAD